MPVRPGLVIGMLAAMLAGGASARDPGGQGERLAIGATGIACVKDPCPRRGVVRLDQPGRDSLRPYWAGTRLPDLQAKAADAARLSSAWNAMACLEIVGAIARPATPDAAPVLRVDRIVGPCR